MCFVPSEKKMAQGPKQRSPERTTSCHLHLQGTDGRSPYRTSSGQHCQGAPSCLLPVTPVPQEQGMTGFSHAFLSTALDQLGWLPLVARGSSWGLPRERTFSQLGTGMGGVIPALATLMQLEDRGYCLRGQMQRAFLHECGYDGTLSPPPPSLETRAWLLLRPGRRGWGDGFPLLSKSKLLWKPTVDISPLGMYLNQKVPAVYLLEQNRHGQNTVSWVPEEQARGQVILCPASSQTLGWAAGRCLQVSDLPVK